jgi:methylphosphotriester-DNA--protein-cysteine methyltransferase
LSSPIKVSKNGIYYSLAYSSYKRTKAKSCFSTLEAAQAAGFRAPKR